MATELPGQWLGAPQDAGGWQDKHDNAECGDLKGGVFSDLASRHKANTLFPSGHLESDGAS